MRRRHPYRLVAISPGRTAIDAQALMELEPRLAPLDRIPGHLSCLPQVVLVEGPDGAPAWEPSLFLAHVAIRSNSITGDTVRTYGEALLPWLSYLSRRELTVETADEEAYGLYRAKLSQATKAGGRRYASATVNLRMVVPALFHEWGQRRSSFTSPLGAYLVSLDSQDRREWSYFRRRTKVVRRIPVALTRDETSQIIRLASYPYALMWKWALVSGLRRFELCELKLDQLPSPEKIALSDGMLQIRLLRKGGAELPVYLPAFLLEETNWYVLVDRAEPKSEADASFLFLTEKGARMSRQLLSRQFRAAADRVGSEATLHHLRHTFAVRLHSFLVGASAKDEEVNPQKTLQVLLGHAHFATSEIYLTASSLAHDAVRAALDSIFGGWNGPSSQ